MRLTHEQIQQLWDLGTIPIVPCHQPIGWEPGKHSDCINGEHTYGPCREIGSGLHLFVDHKTGHDWVFSKFHGFVRPKSHHPQHVTLGNGAVLYYEQLHPHILSAVLNIRALKHITILLPATT